MSYPEGSLIRVSWKYRNNLNSGGLYDPDNPKLTVKSPLGDKVTYTYPADTSIVKDEMGMYHFDLIDSIAGEHILRAWATGNGQASSYKISVIVDATI